MIFRSSRADDEAADALVHDELTDTARERLLQIIKDRFHRDELDKALKMAKRREPGNPFRDFSSARKQLAGLILDSPDDMVLSYIEYLFYVTSDERHRLDQPTEAFKEVMLTLESEGILIDVYTDDDGNIHFREISSEEFKESDEQLRGLASKGWDDELEPYRKAMTMYSDGEYTYKILEKLNVSIEKVIKKICLEEGWTDKEDQSSGHYISILKEKGFFEANPVMEHELNNLLQAMDMLRSKIEGDRKRHQDLSRNYCTLIMHQSSAYLHFLITQYENNY